MATTTKFTGEVVGSFQDPRRADQFIRVMACEDGMTVIAWGSELESASEDDEIFLGGCGDGDSGYIAMKDEEAAAYLGDSFFGTLAAEDWNFCTNGDVLAGLCLVGNIDDDGVMDLATDLTECGLQWYAMTKLARKALEDQRGEWDPE